MTQEDKAKEFISRISTLNNDIYKYITDTEHWLFYWIANKEVQDFIKEYPEDYEERVCLSIENIGSSIYCKILFDDHPDEITSITRYATLATFRVSTKAKWMEWNDKIIELQISEKEKELAYYKKKIGEIEKAILDLKTNKNK